MFVRIRFSDFCRSNLKILCRLISLKREPHPSPKPKDATYSTTLFSQKKIRKLWAFYSLCLYKAVIACKPRSFPMPGDASSAKRCPSVPVVDDLSNSIGTLRAVGVRQFLRDASQKNLLPLRSGKPSLLSTNMLAWHGKRLFVWLIISIGDLFVCESTCCICFDACSHRVPRPP